MPSKSNDAIADLVVREGWFRSQTKAGMPSDNWRIVEDPEGRQALLYIVRFHTTSKRGEPKRIPNEPNALGRLANLNGQFSPVRSGPFIVLAEESPAKITHVRLWDISSELPPARNKLEVAQLGRPVCEYVQV